MNSPTHRQLEVLTLLRLHPQPSIRDLGDILGIKSTNGVNEHLHALERKGCISRRPNQARSITVTPLGLRWLNAERKEVAA